MVFATTILQLIKGVTMSQRHPFSQYAPTASLKEAAKSDLAVEMWECVSREDNLQKMIATVEEGKTPLLPLDDELHERFHDLIEKSQTSSDDLRILCKNMMKSILEKEGYTHVGCTLVPQGKFAKDCGLFSKTSEL